MVTTILLILGIYLLGVVIALLLWCLDNRISGENHKPNALPLLSWCLIIIELTTLTVHLCSTLFNKINDKLCTNQGKQ